MAARVLVTGAGSGVGQGVLKALQLSGLDLDVVAADISPFAAGLYWSRERAIIPRLEDPGAIGSFIDLLQERAIDIVLPGSEYDVLPLAHARDLIARESATRVAVADAKWVEIADDKWLTNQFLSGNGIAVPPSTIDTSRPGLEDFLDQVHFPLIVKPRRGTSSRNVAVVKSMNDLEKAIGGVEHPMVQELVETSSSQEINEFTCSAFRDWNGRRYSVFCARRTLRAGSSWLLEVSPSPDVEQYVHEVANVFANQGPLNVQLILGEDGPRAFELNCRFSGTTGIRALAGANEPEASVRSLLYGESSDDFRIRPGVAIRYLDEVFLEAQSLDGHPGLSPWPG